MNELVVFDQAMPVVRKIADVPLIDVVDERSNVAASENMKLIKLYKDEIETMLEPVRVALYEPYQEFNRRKKVIMDAIDGQLKNQSTAIGVYNRKVLDELNRKRQEEARAKAEEEARKRQEELQAKADAEALRKSQETGEVVKAEVVAPVVVEPVEVAQVETMKAKTGFASSTVKMKPAPTITDKVMFLDALMTSGNAAFINLIFDKVNESQLKKFCEAMKIDGAGKKFPGLAVEMVADVKVR